jgi:hypothetical protein
MLEDCQLDTEVFWAIEDILPRCNMMMVYARGGSGKTYLGSSIALGIGAGRWFDHEAERGAVLICAFERPEDTEDRIAALRDRLALRDLPVALLKLGGKRLDDQAADLIVTRAKELADRTSMPVRVIEIDTVSAALGGLKEDDDGLGRLRMIGERIHAETGALVVWIHHEGKGDHMGPRGHLTLADGCMVWWHVEEREDGSRVVHVAKANRGPSHVPLFAFKLLPFEAGRDRRNKPIQLCELQRVDLEAALASPARRRFGQAPADPDAKLGSRQKLLLRLLEKLNAKHPAGVERTMLRSHFILELNTERERKGLPALPAAPSDRRYPSYRTGSMRSMDCSAFQSDRPTAASERSPSLPIRGERTGERLHSLACRSRRSLWRSFWKVNGERCPTAKLEAVGR